MAIFTDPSISADTITGSDDSDTFIWRGGDDSYVGGGGEDTLRLEDPAATVWRLEAGKLTGTFSTMPPVDLTTSSIEMLEFVANTNSVRPEFIVDGSEGADSIAVSAALDIPYVVYSDAGDDTLIARGIGGGELYGGADSDTFRVQTQSGQSLIYGDSGTDRLIVDALLENVVVQIDEPTRFSSGTTTTLTWDGKSVRFQSDIELVEFADQTPDGSALVLGYDDFIEPVEIIAGTDAGEVIRGTLVDNVIDALGGNDWITLLGGDDTVDGGAGTDMLSFAEHREAGVRVRLPDNQVIIGQRDTLTVSNIENFTGTSTGDSFSGDDGANWFRGIGGRDSFYASAGGDLIDGGAGADSYFGVLGDETAMNVSLLRGRVWEGTGEGTRLSNIEFIFSGAGDDTLTGNHQANLLYGGRGDDTIMGNGGDDIINGEQGMDTAVYGYARDAYTVTAGINAFGGDVIFVEYIGAGPGDGIDTLAAVEVLRFTDGDMIL